MLAGARKRLPPPRPREGGTTPGSRRSPQACPLRAWGADAAGDLEGAGTALDESLRLARLEDENFGIRSADYETALTLDALVRLRSLTGEPADELEAERDGIFERLGVVKVPEPPLPG